MEEKSNWTPFLLAIICWLVVLNIGLVIFFKIATDEGNQLYKENQALRAMQEPCSKI